MKKLRLKETLFPVQRTEHRIILGTMTYGIGHELQDNTDDHLWQLLLLLDGTKTTKEIISLFHKKTGLTKASIRDTIDTLLGEGFLEDAGALTPKNLTTQELERYERSSRYFSLVDRKKRSSPLAIQARLKDATVTILGLGAVGTSVAIGLVKTGVGTISVVDFDNVSVANLNRQLLFDDTDVGKKKVSVGTQKLQVMNPYVRIVGVEKKLVSRQDVDEATQGSDLVIVCADEPFEKLRSWVNAVALKKNIPWIETHLSGPVVGVSLFLPWETPCYECVLHAGKEEVKQLELKNPKDLERPVEQSAIAPTVIIAGQFVVLEAISYLGDLSPRTSGKQFRQNLLLLDDASLTPLVFWSRCPACSTKKSRT